MESTPRADAMAESTLGSGRCRLRVNPQTFLFNPRVLVTLLVAATRCLAETPRGGKDLNSLFQIVLSDIAWLYLLEQSIMALGLPSTY